MLRVERQLLLSKVKVLNMVCNVERQLLLSKVKVVNMVYKDGSLLAIKLLHLLS